MIELVEGKSHIVVKRDGREEQYNPDKMRKVLEWAVKKALKEGNYKIDEKFITDDLVNRMVDEVLEDTKIKIYNRIHITKLFDSIIDTCANKISELQPVWDDVAKNLLIQKYYKDVWGIKRDEYPNYLEVIKKGVHYGEYNKEVIDTFTEEELLELGEYIKQERDFLFTFGGFELFMLKYAKKYSKNKYLELPQHTFMRVAIQLHYKDKNRMELIKKRYDMMSLHKIATATPIMLNSLSQYFNPVSCVLIETDDDSESIMESLRSMGIYSKYASGIGWDVSRIRSIGSTIRKTGTSSGKIPFIKMGGSVVKGFNQQGLRSGSAAVYFNWWDLEVFDLIMLKDAGGNDTNRERFLKYAIKTNDLYYKKLLNDEEVFLFDPKDVPELLNSYGEEFEKWYEYYSNKNIRKKKVKAQDIEDFIDKVRQETGNLYWFSVDNANNFRACSNFIPAGNLCCSEVMLPTKPLKVTKNKIFIENGKYIEQREVDGEIGICNLTSINLLAWDTMTDKEKDDFIYTLLIGMDNSIDYGFYPVKAGERFNRKHRAIGVGITNYHNWLASKKIKASDLSKSLKITHEIMEDIYYYLVKNSIQLAKERSVYDYYEGSLWEKGIFAFELYEKHFDKIKDEIKVNLNFPYRHDWGTLRKEMKKYGVRFEFLFSIPPGATSSVVMNFTKGIDFITDYKFFEKGTYTLPFLAPNLHKNRAYYELAFDIPIEVQLLLGAVRQKFLDQGQSLTTFYRKLTKKSEVAKEMILANKLGLKSLYYLKTPKKELSDKQEDCENCAV